MPGKVRHIGPYSRPDSLAKLDRRTREWRYIQGVVAQLTKHVGGNPSPVQAALIQRAAWLSIRVAVFDKKFARTSTMSERDSNTYIAWSNCLTRTLTKIGLKEISAKPPSLDDIAAQITAEKASAA